MQQLNLPKYDFNIKKNRNSIGFKIFDEFRKKFVVLTPEEWVRQNFCKYLITEKDFPVSMIAVEISLAIYNLKKRADIVIYDKFGKIRFLIECKSPNIEINQKTFEQILRYDMQFDSEYLILTNGMIHFCCKINKIENKVLYLKNIPNYKDI